HSDAVEVVPSDQIDHAGCIKTFEDRPEIAEQQIRGLADHDQGEVELSRADERGDLCDGGRALLDHAHEVVALNDAHAALLRRTVTANASTRTTISPAATDPTTSAAGVGGFAERTATGAGPNAALVVP